MPLFDRVFPVARLARIARQPQRWKDVLPRPLATCIGKLSLQSKRQMHTSKSLREILHMLRLDLSEMSLQRGSAKFTGNIVMRSLAPLPSRTVMRR